MTNHARAGRDREHQVRDHLAAHGHPAIMRAAASKGAADLLHGSPDYGALLVQVGTRSKALNQEARDRFVDAADLCHALPLLATVIPTPGKATVIRFHVVTREVPSRWEEWKP